MTNSAEKNDDLRDGIVSLIPKLRAYATILLRSTSDADDLVQDVLIRAWRFKESFQPGTNLAAWMFRILRNEFLSQASRRARHVAFNGEDYRLDFSQEPDQEWRSAYSEMLDALNELPEPSRQALLLVGACGLSYEEAGTVCDCAPGTIKSRVSRARTRLADRLDYEFRSPASHERRAAPLSA